MRVFSRHRSFLTTALEVAGLACVDAGVFRVSITAGLVAVGVSLMLIGVLEA